MDSFEWNKVFAAVISAALVIMVITTFSDVVFHEEQAEKPAYTIEVATAAGPADAVVEEGPSLAELMAVASADKGARQFGKCKSCHTMEKGGKNGTGPNLFGILGRTVAADDTFKYSSVLSEAATQQWTYELLDEWLKSPKNTFKGTTMSFAGIRKPEQRADLIAYMRSFSDEPMPLPTVEEAMEAAQDEAESAAEAAEGASGN